MITTTTITEQTRVLYLRLAPEPTTRRERVLALAQKLQNASFLSPGEKEDIEEALEQYEPEQLITYLRFEILNEVVDLPAAQALCAEAKALYDEFGDKNARFHEEEKSEVLQALAEQVQHVTNARIAAIVTQRIQRRDDADAANIAAVNAVVERGNDRLARIQEVTEEIGPLTDEMAHAQRELTEALTDIKKLLHDRRKERR